MTAERLILITINDEGISIEGQGFQGSGCVAEVSRAAHKLGMQGQLEKKPEYHQHQNSASTQEIKQKS